MTKRIELSTDSELQTNLLLGKIEKHELKFPKNTIKANELNARRKAWGASIKLDKTEKIILNPIKAVNLTASNLNKIRAIHESTTPTAEAIKNQQMGPDEISGMLYSSLIALEYSKMKSEYQKLLKSAKTNARKNAIEAQWSEIVNAAQTAYARAGLKLDEKGLESEVKKLTSSKVNFNTIATISSRAVPIKSQQTSIKTASVVAGLVTLNEILPIQDIEQLIVPDLCSRPFTQGSFTKHFAKTFSLSFRITYWCPTWRKPWKTCTKTVTLASLSFSIDVNVGYRVSCCGAAAWGQASAQVCGSILGVTKCASCTARIAGVAGFGRTSIGNNCVYGLGIQASLVCTFGSATVLNLQAPFGWNINGPCPPAGLC